MLKWKTIKALTPGLIDISLQILGQFLNEWPEGNLMTVQDFYKTMTLMLYEIDVLRLNVISCKNCQLQYYTNTYQLHYATNQQSSNPEISWMKSLCN